MDTNTIEPRCIHMPDDGFAFDFSSFSVLPLHDDTTDLEYWLRRTPEERLKALEHMRRLNYDYDPATDRIKQVIEIIQQ